MITEEVLKYYRVIDTATMQDREGTQLLILQEKKKPKDFHAVDNTFSLLEKNKKISSVLNSYDLAFETENIASGFVSKLVRPQHEFTANVDKNNAPIFMPKDLASIFSLKKQPKNARSVITYKNPSGETIHNPNLYAASSFLFYTNESPQEALSYIDTALFNEENTSDINVAYKDVVRIVKDTMLREGSSPLEIQQNIQQLFQEYYEGIATKMLEQNWSSINKKSNKSKLEEYLDNIKLPTKLEDIVFKDMGTENKEESYYRDTKIGFIHTTTEDNNNFFKKGKLSMVSPALNSELSEKETNNEKEMYSIESSDEREK